MKFLRYYSFFVLTLGLIAQSHAEIDQVEVQWALCESNAEDLVQKLGYDADEEAAYMVSYFDTPEFTLRANGVSARVTQKTKGSKTKYKSKVKVEFRDINDIDFVWLDNHGGECEYDQYGLQRKTRCAIDNKPGETGSLWSREQSDFLSKYRPGLSLANSKIMQWGPFQGRELELSLTSKLSATVTEVVAGRQPVSLIEFSVRVPVQQAASTHQYVATLFQSRGVRLCDTQGGMFERILSAYYR